MKINTSLVPDVTLILTGNGCGSFHRIEVHYQEEEIGEIWWSNRKNAIDSVEVCDPAKEPRMVVFMALVHNQDKLREWIDSCEL